MARLVVAVAFVTLFSAPLAVADEKKAEPPWAKVTLNAGIGGKPDKDDPQINARISAGPGIKAMSWLGPTPPSAKRLSVTDVAPDGAVEVTVLKLSKGLWLTVWMEPNEEYLAVTRESQKVKEGETDPKRLRLLRWEAIQRQSIELDRLADPFQRNQPAKPIPIIFEGEVAVPDKTLPLASILAVGRLTLQPRLKKDAVVPEPGGAWVVGGLESGKFDIGSGQTSGWAIRNGTSPIALVGKGAEGVGDLKGDVKAIGRLLVGPDRQLLLEVDELKPLKK